MSTSLHTHGPQHARPPCPSPSLGVFTCTLMSIESAMPSNHLILCPLFFFCLQSFPASESFPVSQLFASGGQSIGASASVLPEEYSGLISFRINWLDVLAVQGTLTSLFQHYSLKASIFHHSAFFIVQLSHSYMTAGKIIAWIIWAFVGKVVSLLFNTLSRFVITFLPGSRCLPGSWLRSPSTVILKPRKRKSVSASFSLSVCHEVMGLDAMILVLTLSFKTLLSLFSFTLIKWFCSSSSLSSIRVVSSAYLRLLIFLRAVLIPDCNSSSPAFCMTCSVYKLNKQPCRTPFSILNQSVVPYRVLTVAS